MIADQTNIQMEFGSCAILLWSFASLLVAVVPAGICACCGQKKKKKKSAEPLPEETEQETTYESKYSTTQYTEGGIDEFAMSSSAEGSQTGSVTGKPKRKKIRVKRSKLQRPQPKKSSSAPSSAPAPPQPAKPVVKRCAQYNDPAYQTAYGVETIPIEARSAMVSQQSESAQANVPQSAPKTQSASTATTSYPSEKPVVASNDPNYLTLVGLESEHAFGGAQAGEGSVTSDAIEP